MQTVNMMILIGGGALWLIMGVLLVLFFFNRKYKHTVEVREIVSAGKKRVRIYKACDHLSQGKKVKQWKIRFMRDPLKKYIPVPPNEVIDIDHKGRNFVVVYITETGEKVFRKDDIVIGEIPKDFYSNPPREIMELEFEEREPTLQLWKKVKYKEWCEKNGITVGFRPYTTNQRIMHVNNARRAEEQRAKGTIEKYLPIIGIGVVIIFQMVMFILIAVFWADLTEPVVTVQNMKTAQLEIQRDTAEILQGIKDDVQVIKSGQETVSARQDDITKKIQDTAFYKVPN